MNEEQFRNRFEERIKNRIERRMGRWEQFERRSSRGRVWAGMFILIAGGLLLLKTLNVLVFPFWFFTWPVFLIALGLFIGIRHGFTRGFWIVPVLVGSLVLINNINPYMQLTRFIAPIIVIAIGLMFLLKPKRNFWDRTDNEKDRLNDTQDDSVPSQADTSQPASSDRRDYLDITSVFGGVKKNVLSKNFKGGDVVCFMGGAEINLTQADFTGHIKMDTTNIFGGLKLIVPPTWDVQSDVVAIFGGVDDKRQIGGVNLDPNKVLILDGTCLFGGIEIRSF